MLCRTLPVVTSLVKGKPTMARHYYEKVLSTVKISRILKVLCNSHINKTKSFYDPKAHFHSQVITFYFLFFIIFLGFTLTYLLKVIETFKFIFGF